MKSALYLITLAACFTSCSNRTPEQELIVQYMEEHAHDPASYEPVSFEFIGPATYHNTGVIANDAARYGDIYAHTYRATNAFGALRVHTTVFVYNPLLKTVTALEDSIVEAHKLMPAH